MITATLHSGRISSGLAITVTVACILTGLGLKAWRYADAERMRPDAVAAEIGAHMERHGFEKRRDIVFAEGMPMTAVEYAKTGCDGAVTIANLGSNAELLRYVEIAHGASVLLLARATTSPAASTRPGLVEVGAPAGPFLAVAPRQPSSGACAAPLPPGWRSVEAR